mgnify:CR=1 FL=1
MIKKTFIQLTGQRGLRVVLWEGRLLAQGCPVLSWVRLGIGLLSISMKRARLCLLIHQLSWWDPSLDTTDHLLLLKRRGASPLWNNSMIGPPSCRPLLLEWPELIRIVLGNSRWPTGPGRGPWPLGRVADPSCSRSMTFSRFTQRKGITTEMSRDKRAIRATFRSLKLIRAKMY